MKRIVISSVVALVIIGLLTAGYFFYRRYSGEVTEAIRAVPPDAAFIIECRNTQSAIFNLRQTDYWQSWISHNKLSSLNQFADNLLHLDSVFSSDANFSDLWKHKQLVISAHITKADDFDWLFLLEVPRGVDERDAEGLIKKLLPVSSGASRHVYEDVFIYEIATATGRTFSFALSKGILMCSYTSFLVEDAVRQLKSGSSLKSNKSFFAVYKASGKNSDADFYLNYNSFSRFLSMFTNQESAAALSMVSTLAEWSESDVRLTASAILMNGYTSVKDTGQLLSVIRNQQPQDMGVAKILPARTAYLLDIGISDPKSFFEQLQSSYFGSGEAKEKNNNPLLRKADSRKSVSGKLQYIHQLMKENLTSWVGHELALTITESNTANYSGNTYACIEARDTMEAMHALKEICVATDPDKSSVCKTEFYNGHEIGLIKANGILKTVYGKLFESIQKNYFTSVGKYIVFANQASSLRSFIDDADNKKTLSTDNAYKQVIANSEPSSNISIYLNIPRSLNILKAHSSDAMLTALNDDTSMVNPVKTGFSSVVLQYINRNSQIYNHFVFQYSEEVKKNVSLVWSAECDTSVHMKPQVVTDGGSTYFMIQDDANRLYLFDDGGQLLWKKQLDEKIIGDIHSIDFFKNGTQQFLFNTSSFLYLIDKSGAYIGNFPIRLPSPASNACIVTDFDKSRDYKIFVACTNQMLYAYEVNGKTMNGWLYNKPAGNITLPLKYFKVKDKDYLFFSTSDGGMELLDRRGAVRAKVNETIPLIPNSEVGVTDTDDVALAHLVVADVSGSIYNIYTNGVTKKIISNHFNPPVSFNMTDINNDGKDDYVLFGNNTITVQQADSNVLYTHEFRNASSDLSICVSGGLVGSVSPSINEIAIFNPDGTIYPGFPVKGSTAFTVTTLNNDGKKYIAAASSNGNIYLYAVE